MQRVRCQADDRLAGEWSLIRDLVDLFGGSIHVADQDGLAGQLLYLVQLGPQLFNLLDEGVCRYSVVLQQLSCWDVDAGEREADSHQLVEQLLDLSLLLARQSSDVALRQDQDERDSLQDAADLLLRQVQCLCKQTT